MNLLDTVLENGKKTDSLSIFDRSLQYRNGIWETIAIRLQQPQFLIDHIKRLELGCKALFIRMLDSELLLSEIKQVCKSCNHQTFLKIIITRGISGRGYRPEMSPQNTATRILSAHPCRNHIRKYQQPNIQLQFCDTYLAYTPQLAGFKHLNRLERVLGSSELTANYQEGWRQKIMKWIGKHCKSADNNMNYTVSEEPLNINDVRNAMSILMSNSIIGIWPVHTFENKTYQIPSFVDGFNQYMSNH